MVMYYTLLRYFTVFRYLCFTQISYGGGVLFSTLPENLVVSASPSRGQVLKAGVDVIAVTWGLNQSAAQETHSSYNNVAFKLCYAPISQSDRPWRKTSDNLSKDKTCQFTIPDKSYTTITTTTQNYFTWIIDKDVPTAVYFIRAYAYNSYGDEVAYGQTTNTNKTTCLFKIQAISGRHMSLDLASVCFSAFALLSVFSFFMVEKTRKSAEKATSIRI